MTNDAFNFLVIVPGIVLGLALVQLLNGLASAIQNRATVTHSWIHALWYLTLFLLVIQHWYAIYSWRNFGETFLSYLSFMVYPILLFIASALLMPVIELGQTVCLRTHFFANRAWFFLIASAALIETLVRSIIFGGVAAWSVESLIRACGIALTITLAIREDNRTHIVATPIAFLLTLVYIANYVNGIKGSA